MWLNLYMVALMPDAYLVDIIDSIRKEFARSFGAYAALKPPVHITLQPPFKSEQGVESFLDEAFTRIASGTAPFQVQLNDYGFFREDVVFLHVEKSLALEQLHDRVLHVFEKGLPVRMEAKVFREYNPHITIGYRDIPSEAFPAIRERYTHLRFRDGFTADAFYLWKHNGKHWEILSRYPLNRDATFTAPAAQSALF